MRTVNLSVEIDQLQIHLARLHHVRGDGLETAGKLSFLVQGHVSEVAEEPLPEETEDGVLCLLSQDSLDAGLDEGAELVGCESWHLLAADV